MIASFENWTVVFFLLTRRNIHSLILLAFFKFFSRLSPNAAAQPFVAVCESFAIERLKKFFSGQLSSPWRVFAFSSKQRTSLGTFAFSRYALNCDLQLTGVLWWIIKFNWQASRENSGTVVSVLNQHIHHLSTIFLFVISVLERKGDKNSLFVDVYSSNLPISTQSSRLPRSLRCLRLSIESTSTVTDWINAFTWGSDFVEPECYFEPKFFNFKLCNSLKLSLKFARSAFVKGQSTRHDREPIKVPRPSSSLCSSPSLSPQSLQLDSQLESLKNSVRKKATTEPTF